MPSDAARMHNTMNRHVRLDEHNACTGTLQPGRLRETLPEDRVKKVSCSIEATWGTIANDCAGSLKQSQQPPRV